MAEVLPLSISVAHIAYVTLEYQSIACVRSSVCLTQSYPRPPPPDLIRAARLPPAWAVNTSTQPSAGLYGQWGTGADTTYPSGERSRPASTGRLSGEMGRVDDFCSKIKNYCEEVRLTGGNEEVLRGWHLR